MTEQDEGEGKDVGELRRMRQEREAERVGRLIGVELYHHDPIVFHGVQVIASGRKTEDALVAMIRAYAGAYALLMEQAQAQAKAAIPTVVVATQAEIDRLKGVHHG